MSDAQIPHPGAQIRALIEDLKAQKKAAEGRIELDRERIAEIDATLPDLERAAERTARREMAAAMPQVPVDAPTASLAGLIQLKRAQDIQQEVRKIAAGLPERCGLADIETALAGDGFEVNQSTLRKNLTEMDRMGDTLKIIIKGKGRRATVFERLPKDAS